MAKTSKKANRKRPAKRAGKAKASPKKTAAKTKKSAKPAARKAQTGHMSIAPGITANDAAASIKFYCDVLGFTLAEKWERDGVFRGGRVASGGVSINIGQDDWKMGRDRAKGQGTRMYIQTRNDIDQYAADIKSRGGVLDQEPQDGWGTRSFSLSDPDGFKLTIMGMRA